MKSLIFFLFLFLSAWAVSAQQMTIKGKVTFEKPASPDDSVPSAYQIEILYQNGNTPAIIKKTVQTPDFEVDFFMNTACTVRFSASGYKFSEVVLQKSKSTLIDLGEIHLKLFSAQLQEFTVTARQPAVKMSGSKMTVNVKNTVLSDMGSVSDMLSYTPGLIEGAAGIEVPGKGTPLFIVDGREIKDISILNVLKSDNIESVEIERSPSAAYASNTRAIVYINTIKGIQDYVFLKVNNIASMKRKFSEIPSIDFKYKKGKLSSYITFLYGALSGNLNKETYFKNIYHPDYTFTNESYHEITYRNQGPRLVWSTDFDINKKNRLGLVYYFNYDDTKENNLYNTILTDATSVINKYANKSTLSDDYQNSISLSYNFTPNKTSRLNLVTDYAISRVNSNYRTKETNLDTQASTDILTTSNSNYDVFTANGRYDFVLPYKIQTQIGGKYSYVTTSPTTRSDNPYLNGGNYYSRLDVNDQIVAGFITASKNWKNFGLKFGLRYENAITNVSSLGSGSDDKNNASQRYSDFFPNLGLNYSPTKLWNFSLNYSRSTSRPGYYMLNPSLIYSDSLSYNEGNVRIRPSFTQNISLYANWKNWSLDFSYDNKKDAFMSVLINKNQNSNILNSVPLNFPKLQEFSSGLSYQKTIKKFNIYASVWGSIPHFEYPFMDRTITTKMFSWNSSDNITYTLNKKIAFYTMFTYQGQNEYMNSFQKSVNQWNIGIRGKFLKDRLTVDLQVMDILHGSNYNNLYDRYLNVKTGTYGTNDFRGVRLSLSYTIFNKDIQVRAQRENEDVLMRTSR